MIDLALIPARGGSKGLPGKNILDLFGKPLISHTIDAAIQSGVFKRIVVSTDDNVIAEVSDGANAEVQMRPVALARDESSSLDVIEHVLAENGLVNGSFCLLQPTSPLRNAGHIREAAKMFRDCTESSVISASELEHHPLKSLILQSDGRYAPPRQMKDLVSPRQSLPHAITPNGAIYFCDIARFRASGEVFFPDTVFYLMPIEYSLDIDSHADLVRANEYLTKKEAVREQAN